MAIVQCPVCRKRISSVAKACPHCQSELGEMTPEKQREMTRQKHKRHLMTAKRLSLWSLVLTFVGASLWWFESGGIWQWPPSSSAVTLLGVGLAGYLTGRGWILWLHLTRSTSKRLL